MIVNKMQGLANKVADGNCEMLANSMNYFCVSVGEHLQGLNEDNEVFAVEGELPDECIISIQTTFKALKQFGGLAGTSTTDALVETTHKWYEATDARNTYVRIVPLDFSKAFDLINHNILLEKITGIRYIGPHLTMDGSIFIG